MPRELLSKVRGARTYPAVISFVAGLIVAGIVIPIASGTSVNSVGSTGVQAAASGSASPATSVTPASPDGLPAGAAPGVAADGGPASPMAGTRNRVSASGTASRPPAARMSAPATRDTSPVKIGFPVYNTAGLALPGLVNAQNLLAGWHAYIDEVNASGGINGRKIAPVFYTYDVTKESSAQAACLYFTEDQHVAAVVGALNFPSADLCITKQHHTPMLTNDIHGDASFSQSQGLLFTIYPGGGRMMTNFAAELDQQHALDKKVIGIATGEEYDPGGVVAQQLADALAKRGHKVAYRAQFAADIQAAAAQAPVFVSQAKARNVDLMLMLIEPFTRGPAWISAARGQNYHPRYATSDWANAYIGGDGENASSINIGSTRYADFTSKQGAVTPAEAACVKTFESRQHRAMFARDSADYGALLLECDLLAILTTGARAAPGGDLSAPTLAAGLATVRRVNAASAAGSFAPGKFAFVDEVRTGAFRSSCGSFGCYYPVDGFHAPAV
jgi:ABC-type branched-subunit amino acid transport system substrate-binding protein